MRANPLSRRRLRSDRRGASTVEYGLILAFVVLMMLGALTNVADVTTHLWNDVAAKVTTAR